MQRRDPARAAFYRDPAYLDLLDRIGANLRRLREARGWTQEECAHRCGDMAPPLLRRIELASTNVTAVTVTRLCKGLGVDPSELFLPAPPSPPRRPGRPKKPAAPKPSA